MRPTRALIIGVLATCVVCSPTHPEARPPRAAPAPRDLLREVGQFTDMEWAAVERGESVARLLDTDAREIAVVGAVRINGPSEALIERYRDIDGLKRSSLVLDARRLSAPPRPSEMRSLSLEEHSLNLRSCRPGSCPVRLGAEDVRRFQREVNWGAPDWRQQSALVWADVLGAYVGAYVAHGRNGLPSYVNKDVPLSVASELALLVREYEFVRAYSPEFHAYLQRFGPPVPAGAEQLLYWTKEDFGVRPILRISHQVVYRVVQPAPVAFIATNQVYADHYLDAALSVTLAIGADDRKGFYMVAVNRARTRSLSGFFRRFVRSTVQNRSREALRKILVGTKLAVESRG